MEVAPMTTAQIRAAMQGTRMAMTAARAVIAFTVIVAVVTGTVGEENIMTETTVTELHKSFAIHPVPGDGSCMFHAVAYGYTYSNSRTNQQNKVLLAPPTGSSSTSKSNGKRKWDGHSLRQAVASYFEAHMVS